MLHFKLIINITFGSKLKTIIRKLDETERVNDLSFFLNMVLREYSLNVRFLGEVSIVVQGGGGGGGVAYGPGSNSVLFNLLD